VTTTETTVAPRRVALALERVIDPELGLNVVDLGLVYGIEVDDGFVMVDLGVTTPSCPYSHRLAEDTAAAALNLPGVDGVDVTLVFDPAWEPSMLSDRARQLLGWR
jgi:metal-sulfur cluster biosynthetic enzyme